MAQADWNEWDDQSDIASLRHGVSVGYTPPAGGGAFIYGMYTAVSAATCGGLRCAVADYGPVAAGEGVSVRGALYRRAEAAHAAYLVANAQGSSVEDDAYLLGVEEVEPGRIVIRKGKIGDGMVTGLRTLAASTLRYAGAAWRHLRLDVLPNANGDVVLNAYLSDLTAHDVTAPVWERIAGLGDPPNGTPSFVDDVLGVNAGSEPLVVGGYVGFAFHATAIGRFGGFDHLEILRTGV